MFTEHETDVMHRMGIRDRDEMRSIRAELLTEGVDWERRGKRVMLTPDAATLIASRLAELPALLASIGARKNAATPKDAATEKKPLTAAIPAQSCLPADAATCLRVVKNDAPNRTLLICEPTPSTGERILVRVRDTSHFLPGSAAGYILAKPVAGATAWQFVGRPGCDNSIPRYPRQPGRW